MGRVCMDSVSVLNSKTLKVYKNNKLNNASFEKFNHNDYQVFLYLISKIGGVDELGKYLQPEKLQREYRLSAFEFTKAFGVSKQHCYRLLKKAADRLMATNIKIEKEDKKEVWRINICSFAKYNKDEGHITIEFTDRIMPYLAQVKQKFLLYNLKEVSNFGSLYTTRLYELIQEFKETGWMLKSVAQLRDVFAVGTKYKLYGHFKAKTFSQACDEINKNYDLNLTFKEIKESRKVVAIKFSFKKTKITLTTNKKTGVTRNLYNKPKKKE